MKNELTVKKANPFFHGDTIQATIKELETTLGKPLHKQNGSGYPFRFDWVMLDSENNRFFVCDCFQDDYSWKYESFNETELMVWHIRAKNKDASIRAKNEVEQALLKTRGWKPPIQDDSNNEWNQIFDELKGLEPRVIGQVSVDLCKIWIGDPLYLNDSVLEKIKWESFDGIKTFQHEKGNEGLGIGISVDSDGMYDVIGFFPPTQSTIDDSANRPLKVMIDFNRW